MAHDIKVEIESGLVGSNEKILITLAFQQSISDALHSGEFKGLTREIAKVIAEKLAPEMMQKVLADPTMKDQIINQMVLILAANAVKEAGDAASKQIMQ